MWFVARGKHQRRVVMGLRSSKVTAAILLANNSAGTNFILN